MHIPIVNRIGGSVGAAASCANVNCCDSIESVSWEIPGWGWRVRCNFKLIQGLEKNSKNLSKMGDAKEIRCKVVFICSVLGKALRGNLWTVCAQGFCTQPSMFVFCAAQSLLWQCPTCKRISDISTILGWRNLFMAFLALCCLKKWFGFEMSCLFCSKAPISSPSNFLHLIETHVFSHMRCLHWRICSSDLREVSVSLISLGDSSLPPVTFLSLLCKSSACNVFRFWNHDNRYLKQETTTT